MSSSQAAAGGGGEGSLSLAMLKKLDAEQMEVATGMSRKGASQIAATAASRGGSSLGIAPSVAAAAAAGKPTSSGSDALGGSVSLAGGGGGSLMQSMNSRVLSDHGVGSQPRRGSTPGAGGRRGSADPSSAASSMRRGSASKSPSASTSRNPSPRRVHFRDFSPNNSFTMQKSESDLLVGGAPGSGSLNASPKRAYNQPPKVAVRPTKASQLLARARTPPPSTRQSKRRSSSQELNATTGSSSAGADSLADTQTSVATLGNSTTRSAVLLMDAAEITEAPFAKRMELFEQRKAAHETEAKKVKAKKIRAECSFKPKLSPHVVKVTAEIEQERELRNAIRRFDDVAPPPPKQFHEDPELADVDAPPLPEHEHAVHPDGEQKRPVMAHETLASRFLGDVPHYMRPPDPKPPPPPRKASPRITKRAKQTKRTLDDLFEWEVTRCMKGVGPPDEEMSRGASPGRRSRGSSFNNQDGATQWPTGGGGSADSSRSPTQSKPSTPDRRRANSKTEVLSNQITMLGRMRRSASSTALARDYAAAERESRLLLHEMAHPDALISRNSNRIVMAMGDRRVTATDHATMVGASHGKEAAERRQEIEMRRLRDIREHERVLQYEQMRAAEVEAETRRKQRRAKKRAALGFETYDDIDEFESVGSTETDGDSTDGHSSDENRDDEDDSLNETVELFTRTIHGNAWAPTPRKGGGEASGHVTEPVKETRNDPHAGMYRWFVQQVRQDSAYRVNERRSMPELSANNHPQQGQRAGRK